MRIEDTALVLKKNIHWSATHIWANSGLMSHSQIKSLFCLQVMYSLVTIVWTKELGQNAKASPDIQISYTEVGRVGTKDASPAAERYTPQPLLFSR